MRAGGRVGDAVVGDKVLGDDVGAGLAVAAHRTFHETTILGPFAGCKPAGTAGVGTASGGMPSSVAEYLAVNPWHATLPVFAIFFSSFLTVYLDSLMLRVCIGHDSECQ